jgi:lysophospholipase L1-like esterase
LNRLKLKALAQNVLLLGFSTAAALGLSELAARLVLNPADYLNLALVPHPVLGITQAPGTAGFDAWGFRNPAVPDTVDIVAIGDSHTYGNCAKGSESWPHVLAGLTGRSVYNLALGGYGPNQYLHLLQTRALALKPRLVLCGLYFGDDFENAYLITYGLDHWASLRRLPAEQVQFDIWEPQTAPSWHKRIRIWLSRHSVVYKLLVHGPWLGRFKGEMQIQHAARLYPGATALILEEQNIREAFLPTGIARRLDQRSPAVREGIRLTLELLRQMHQTCAENGIQFAVVLIPTKETVFAEHLEQRPGLPQGEVIDRLLADERAVRAEVTASLQQAGIPYIDTLPALRAAVGQQLYARTAQDMHPNKNGYRVIAQTVAEHLHELNRPQ